jgi:pyruvate dehydrogenase E2 component (dihydrolipoamide acetyltransferase)
MPVKIIMPKVDMVMDSGTFVEWLKQEGQSVEKGETIFVMTTDKSAIECEAPASGILAGLTAKPGDVIPVTEVIGYILAQGESLPESGAPAQPVPLPPALDTPAQEAPPIQPAIQQSEAAPFEGPAQVRATPLARCLARELGIDLATVTGRGERGRIYQADVRAAAEKRPVPSSSATAFTPVGSVPGISITTPDARVRQRIPLSGPRAIIAQRMSYSASVIPHIYESITVDAGQLYAFRAREMQAVQESAGHKLTYTGIMAFVLSRVLPKHPMLNSSLIGEEIVQWEDVNIGIATDLNDTLIVPVIRRSQQMDLAGITAEMGRLLESARGRRLTPENLRNGTFTISNLGMFGIDSFTAIINPPEAAILAMGRISETPMPNAAIYRTMKLVLGADHRILDGAKVARFLIDLKAALEDPFPLLGK